MNNAKTSNYGKIIAFFLIASILLGTFGFAAEGWQSSLPDDSSAEHEKDDTDGVQDGLLGQAPSEPEPVYYNPLTGLATTIEASVIRPLGFVISTDAPFYGISDTEILIEFTTESRGSRFLSLTTNYKSTGKIGSLTATRDYISAISEYFNAIEVSVGHDGTLGDGAGSVTPRFDLTENPNYHYSEFTHFSYTNGALINAGIVNSGLNSAPSANHPLPFVFENGEITVTPGKKSAAGLVLPFGDGSTSDFYYSAATGKYTMSKNGEKITDMLTGSAVSFDNIFVLFSDCVTYETEECSELVMDTYSGGKGYYINGGRLLQIFWEVDEGGSLMLLDSDGERLVVKAGSSYMGFVKSSMINEVKYS